MNKDQVKGKVKDVAGRIERQAGEWTGDEKKEVHGTTKQAEGKIQNAWGNVKDASKKVADEAKAPPKSPQRSQEVNWRSADRVGNFLGSLTEMPALPEYKA
jgi:uncharacterized protein YjbJ (UPF0337 family)